MFIGLEKEIPVFGLTYAGLSTLGCTNVREMPGTVTLESGKVIAISKQGEQYYALFDHNKIEGPFHRIAAFIENIAAKDKIIKIKNFEEIMLEALAPKD